MVRCSRCEKENEEHDSWCGGLKRERMSGGREKKKEGEPESIYMVFTWHLCGQSRGYVKWRGGQSTVRWQRYRSNDTRDGSLYNIRSARTSPHWPPHSLPHRCSELSTNFYAHHTPFYILLHTTVRLWAPAAVYGVGGPAYACGMFLSSAYHFNYNTNESIHKRTASLDDFQWSRPFSLSRWLVTLRSTLVCGLNILFLRSLYNICYHSNESVRPMCTSSIL